MADKRNNLMPIQEVNSNRSREQHSRDSAKGGINSGKARRRKADIFATLEMVMNKPIVGKPKDLLERMGYVGGDLTTEAAILVTLAVQAMQGDKKAAEILLNYQTQMKENDRKDEESRARILAMTQSSDTVQINSADDEDGGVMIYLPAKDELEDKETSDGEEVTDDAKDS